MKVQTQRQKHFTAKDFYYMRQVRKLTQKRRIDQAEAQQQEQVDRKLAPNDALLIGRLSLDAVSPQTNTIWQRQATPTHTFARTMMFQAVRPRTSVAPVDAGGLDDEDIIYTSLSITASANYESLPSAPTHHRAIQRRLAFSAEPITLHTLINDYAPGRMKT
jgi:hypothetical protein